MNDQTHISLRMQCAQEFADQLFKVESQIEQSLAGAATLIATVAANREALGLSVLHGQKLLNPTIELIETLNMARSRVAEVHTCAAATQRQIGVRTVLGNPGVKPDVSIPDLPATPAHASERAPLKQVA